ncbi:MAG: hypothetical protein J0L84_07520 [Verrucomicrobia bacterium]|nr:hypothetical protein [Verrucomicrobiota bacterium]
MNDPRNSQELWTEVLGPTSGDPRLSASLDSLLTAVRRRRRQRRAMRTAAGAAVLLLAAWGWMRWPSSMTDSGTAPLAVSPASPPPPAWQLSTRPAPPGITISSRAASVVLVVTEPRTSLERISDEELLALAPGCLALTRSARGMEFVALCEGLVATP